MYTICQRSDSVTKWREFGVNLIKLADTFASPFTGVLDTHSVYELLYWTVAWNWMHARSEWCLIVFEHMIRIELKQSSTFITEPHFVYSFSLIYISDISIDFSFLFLLMNSVYKCVVFIFGEWQTMHWSASNKLFHCKERNSMFWGCLIGLLFVRYVYCYHHICCYFHGKDQFLRQSV